MNETVRIDSETNDDKKMRSSERAIYASLIFKRVRAKNEFE
jgi:hypothetical protein